MYVDSCTTKGPKGKIYPRHLLREAYREDGRVKHRTIANLSKCATVEMEAIRLALRHKDDLAALLEAADGDALYANLDWLCVHQARIEDRLFRRLDPGTASDLFLYDVTSSYFEGMHNELSALRLQP